ncbi:MAG: hypothetical protein PHQ40_20625 [Anaerolineaceae bacterium]|nr:hypothetical protein [Anaerolineaceae bacterium]
MPLEALEALLTPGERELFSSLDTPARIQTYLDTTEYPAASQRNRCVISVIRERTAHCLDGALFAAAALWRAGYAPRVVDLFPDPGMDDDHVLAIYQVDGCYGALAKSNFAGLRLREAVYHSLRELVMSYFEDYFNVDGLRTLRTYTRPLNLATYDRVGWMETDAGVDFIEKKLLSLKRIPLISTEAAARLSPVDALSYRAGTLSANPKGLYRPKG